MKPFLVFFTTNNCRIIKDPSLIEQLKDQPESLISPDLDLVKGIPPHFWKKENQAVVPMTEPEQLQRLRSHADFGIDNLLSSNSDQSVKNHILYYLLCAAMPALLIAYYLIHRR